jgi:two-component system NtrC family sensor kinase
VSLNLRSKGLVLILALVLYVGVMGLMLASQRQNLLALAIELEKVYVTENIIAKTTDAVVHSMLKVQEKFAESQVDAVAAEALALDVELIQGGLRVLAESHPKIPGYAAALLQAMAELRDTPSRSGLMKMREVELDLHRHLDRMMHETEERRHKLWSDYRNTYDSMTVIVIAMGLIGVTGFAAVVIYFFDRMVWDIRKLQARMLEIVLGYRGEPLKVTRGDELGSMMHRVNRMQQELRSHEQKLEISREQRFHQEKMAAVGTMAATIAHEINNPIAAIAGIAEAMRDRKPRSEEDENELRRREAQMILDQSRRIGMISRQLAELTRPMPQQPALLDLNELVRSACNFIRYDKRFEGVSVALELDPELPAIEAVADHLMQVILNLMINAADALENCTDRLRCIRIVTGYVEGQMLLRVSDNGDGMDDVVLARAFDESFTTKPAGKGRGLGLFLCRALIEEAGGRIELASTPGTGTGANVYLPVPVAAAAEAA